MNPEQNRKKGGARLLKPSSKKAEAAPEKENEAVPTKKPEFTDRDAEAGQAQKAKKPKPQPEDEESEDKKFRIFKKDKTDEDAENHSERENTD